MKTLQNDFTTPEQSKRLLELGMPEDSANLCYRFYTDLSGDTIMWDAPSVITENQHIEWSHKLTSGDTAYLPCWSVGRLIEIICNCHIITNQFMENWICCDKDTNLIELLISDIEVYIAAGHMDFSKLEE